MPRVRDPETAKDIFLESLEDARREDPRVFMIEAPEDLTGSKEARVRLMLLSAVEPRGPIATIRMTDLLFYGFKLRPPRTPPKPGKYSFYGFRPPYSMWETAAKHVWEYENISLSVPKDLDQVMKILTPPDLRATGEKMSEATKMPLSELVYRFSEGVDSGSLPKPPSPPVKTKMWPPGRVELNYPGPHAGRVGYFHVAKLKRRRKGGYEVTIFLSYRDSPWFMHEKRWFESQEELDDYQDELYERLWEIERAVRG